MRCLLPLVCPHSFERFPDHCMVHQHATTTTQSPAYCCTVVECTHLIVMKACCKPVTNITTVKDECARLNSYQLYGIAAINYTIGEASVI